MNVQRYVLPLVATAFIYAIAASGAQAQSASVFTSGLGAPTRSIMSAHGNLLVAEAGGAPNTGRVSIVDKTGNRRTLVNGLPSGLAPPEGDPSGPAGLAMSGRTLYVVIGAGDSTIAGSAPDSDVPNPNPSSAIFSSVLSIHFSAHVEKTTQGFELTTADQATLKSGKKVVLKSGGQKVVIRLVADFPDYTAEPRPDEPDNVRDSNPFGIALDAQELFVVDASQDTVAAIDRKTGDIRTLATLPPVTNPLPFGPPVTDAVPDSIHDFGDKLLVTELTGFPFPQGQAAVLLVDKASGSVTPYIDGLSSAIDALPVKAADGSDVIYVLEFSTDMLGNPPGAGRLLRFDAPGQAPALVLDGLPTPTCVVRDPSSGDLFVTEIFPGLIVRITE